MDLQSWIAFEKSNIWAAFLWDIEDRKKYLTDLLVQGKDPDWNDDVLRGKLSELEFFINLPDMIKASIIIESKTKIKEVEDGRGE